MNIELVIIDQRLSGLEYASPNAAAVDLRACSVHGERLDGTFVLNPDQQVSVGTGVAIHIGSGMAGPLSILSAAGLILPRSGLGKRGIRLTNTIGLIDPDYQGELICTLVNGGDAPWSFQALNRVAQLVVFPILTPTYRVVDKFSALTERGGNGFGSTGVA